MKLNDIWSLMNFQHEAEPAGYRTEEVEGVLPIAKVEP